MLACFEPLAYSISVVLSWLFRRGPSKRASCLIIGDLGVGKTSLISILMDEEPDVHVSYPNSLWNMTANIL